jgi:predicted acylesterase/phospholipase RssA
MTFLRIALTLPGAVSLGAFEAGAVAALLSGVQAVNAEDPDAVDIDVITAASAGSLTGLLAARVLLEGKDPVPVFHRAWVVDPTLHQLRGEGWQAPLSSSRVRARARALLELRDVEDFGSPQGTEIALDMALGGLRGFEYEVGRPERRVPLRATSHLDWGPYTFKGSGDDDVAGAMEVAWASAAHPAAFPAALLDRSELRCKYEENRIRNLPPEGQPLSFWYVDGGVLDNEPLGRCLDVVGDIKQDDNAERLVLVVRPDPEPAPAKEDPAWTGRCPRPRWTVSLTRALRMLVTHSLYEDLRRVQKTNSRIRWTDDLADTLADLLKAAPRAREELEGVLDRIARDKAWLDRAGKPDSGPKEPESLAALVRRVLGEATGLHEKIPVGVEVITAQPAAVGAGARSPRVRLAGTGLANFGGFLARRFREHDFAVGYHRAVAWMADSDRGLKAYGLPKPLATRAVEAATTHGPAEPKAAPRPLSLVAWVRAGKLAGRALLVGVFGRGGRRRRAGA